MYDSDTWGSDQTPAMAAGDRSEIDKFEAAAGINDDQLIVAAGAAIGEQGVPPSAELSAELVTEAGFKV